MDINKVNVRFLAWGVAAILTLNGTGVVHLQPNNN